LLQSSTSSEAWVRSLPKGKREALAEQLTPRLNGYIPHTPTVKQAAFLLLDCKEAFYGGAAGPGKSDGLLMAALQYFDMAGYSALLLRKSYADLSLPEALMDRTASWLKPTDARWYEKSKTWVCPGGGTLTFGYLETENDKFRYKSAAFQFIGFDELTQFTETQYTYLFSRLRRLMGAGVPLRMRSASNPGDVGHQWVKQRFMVEGPGKGRIFVPARLEDNPHLDRESYIESLAELDPISRRQLLDGDWSARHEGGMFRREWFEIVDEAPAQAKWARYWDLAGTEPKPGTDPDWTAGLKMGVAGGVYYIGDVQRIRGTPRQAAALVKQTADIDGKPVEIRMEQEPGSSGIAVIDHYCTEILAGFTFRGDRVTGSKIERAAPFSSMAEAGNVKLVRGPWIGDFLDELELFPHGAKKDQVDAASGAFRHLTADAIPTGLRVAGLTKGSYWKGMEAHG